MYLKKVGATYYFYPRVPRNLFNLLGKTEVKKSLKTKDQRQADSNCLQRPIILTNTRLRLLPSNSP
jgi:hypothetical protein